MWMRGLYLGVSCTSYLKRAEFQRSPIFEILLYLCLHPLTQDDQTGHGNIWRVVCLGEVTVSHAIAVAQMRCAVCQL